MIPGVGINATDSDTPYPTSALVQNHGVGHICIGPEISVTDASKHSSFDHVPDIIGIPCTGCDIIESSSAAS